MPGRRKLYPGWIMVAVAFCSLAVSAGGLTYSYSVVTVILNQEFRVSQFQLMLPMTLMMLASAFCSPYLGPKMDRFPLRRFMFAGVACMAISLLLMSVSPSMTYITAIYAVIMAPVHALLGTLSSSVLISRWFVNKLALAMGIASVGVSVGGFLIPPMLEAMCSYLGWRESFRILAGVVVITMVPLIMLVRDRPSDQDLPAGVDSTLKHKLQNREPSAFNSASAILRSRNFWLMGVCIGLLFGVYTALISNLLPMVMIKGLSSQEGARLVAIISGVAIVGKLAIGALTDRIDLRIGLAITINLVIAGMFIYRNGSTFYHFVGGSVVLGLAVGNMLPIWSAMIARLFGAADYGRVMGMMSPFNVTANIIAVPFTGFLYDRTGSYAWPLAIFMLLLAITMLWLPAIKPTSSQ